MKGYLLDTNAWIFAEETPDRLGKITTKLLLDPSTKIFISPISTLEISQLIYRNKIKLSCQLSHWIEMSTENLMLSTLAIEHKTMIMAYSLPEEFHKDPADRILIATSIEHNLKLITADEKILDNKWINSVDARK